MRAQHWSLVVGLIVLGWAMPALAAVTHNSIDLIATGANDNVGVTSYRWMHLAGACGNPTSANIIATTPGNSFTHTGLAANSTHCYRVDARDAANLDSPDSNTLQVTTAAAPAAPPTVSNAVYASWTAGNDTTGNGTKGNPYKTPGKACTVVQPGGTVILRGTPSPGKMTYALTGNFKCTKGTSWNAPVTFTHEPGENVELWTNTQALQDAGTVPNTQFGDKAFRQLDVRQQNEDLYFIVRGEDDPSRPLPNIPPGYKNKFGKRLIFRHFSIAKNGSSNASDSNMPGNHVKIDNIEVMNATDVNSIAVGNHWEVRNSYFHHNGRFDNNGWWDGTTIVPPGAVTDPKTQNVSTDHNIYTHCSNCLFEDNIFDITTGYALQLTNNLMAKSGGPFCERNKPDLALGNPQPAGTLQGCGLVNVTVRRNLLRNALNGGLSLHTGPNHRFFNNIFHNNPVVGNLGSVGAKFYNNTMVSGQVVLSGGAHNAEFRNNIIWRPGSTSTTYFKFLTPTWSPNGAQNVVFSNNLTSTSTSAPIVTNANAGDFRLPSNSPAVNAGQNLAGIVTEDFFGAARPVGGAWDIGAHEFGGTVTPGPGDTTPPSVPANLALTLVSPTQVDLNWDDSTGTPAGYHVYRCSGVGCAVGSTPLASPTPSAYSDPTVVGSTSYTYAVASFDSVPNTSGQSAPASITTSAPVADISAPDTPTNLTCTAVGADQINLDWTASVDNPNPGGAGVAGYRLRRCAGAACAPTVQVGTTATTDFANTGLSASTTYGFAVAAFDAASPANVSADSTPTCYATTPAAAVGPTMVLLLNNTTTDTGSLASTPTASGLTFTTNAAQRAEGSHAAVFDNILDYISVPLTAVSGVFTEPPLIDTCDRTQNPLASGWAHDLFPSDGAVWAADGSRCLRGSGTQFGSVYWNPSPTLGPDMALSATFADATAAAGSFVELFVRVVSPNVTNVVDGYACQFTPGSGSVTLLRYVDGATGPTTLQTCTSQVFADGDKIACQMTGSSLKALQHRGSGWAQMCTATSTAYGGTGYGGLRSNTTALALDDIRLGTVTAAGGGSSGFVSATNTTIRVSFYADTAFAAGVERYIFGDTTAPTRGQRRYIYTDGARLAIGLGDNPAVTNDVLGADLALNTLYRVALRIRSDGAWDAVLMRNGTGVIRQVSGTYTGLTALNANAAVGNVEPAGNEGWRGSIDTFMLDNRVLSDAELNTDCQTYVTSCTSLLGTAPTFDALDLVSGTLGDTTTAANNTLMRVTLGGSVGPDPAACATLGDFQVFYDQAPQGLSSCSISGTALQLRVTAPPVSPTVPVSLTYRPTAEQITITNSIVIDPTTGNNLQQAQWWCRRPGPVALTRWRGLPNEACLVPSPGAIDVQMDLIWVGAGSSPTQNYALYCDATPDDELDQGVRVGAQFDEHGSLPIRYAAQGTNALLLHDGAPITPELPDITGITAVPGGSMRRQEAATAVPVLSQNQRTEYRFALEFASGIASQLTYACELRPAPTGARLSTVVPARILVGPSRFIAQ